MSDKKMPQWLKVVIAASAGAGAVTGGHKLATDSPVHFAVEGAAPVEAPGWKCAPEGGLIGAPMVCRPDASAQSIATDTTVGTDTK